MSTSSVLAFGVDFGNEFPEVLLQRFEELGLDHEYPWFEELMEAEMGEEKWPVDMEYYAHADDSKFFLYVCGTRHSSELWETTPVSANDLEISPDKIVAFKGWMKDHGLEEQEPQWHLMAWVG